MFVCPWQQAADTHQAEGTFQPPPVFCCAPCRGDNTWGFSWTVVPLSTSGNSFLRCNSTLPQLGSVDSMRATFHWPLWSRAAVLHALGAGLSGTGLTVLCLGSFPTKEGLIGHFLTIRLQWPISVFEGISTHMPGLLIMETAHYFMHFLYMMYFYGF